MAECNSLSTSSRKLLEISSFNDVPSFISETRNTFAEEDQYCHALADLISSAKEEQETQDNKIHQQKKKILVLKQRISDLESTNTSLKLSVTSSKIEAENIAKQCDKKLVDLEELNKDIDQKKWNNANKLDDNLKKYPEEYHLRKDEVERIKAQYQQMQNKMDELNFFIKEKEVREKFEMKKLIIEFAENMTIMKQQKRNIAELDPKIKNQRNQGILKSTTDVTRNSNTFSKFDSDLASSKSNVQLSSAENKQGSTLPSRKIRESYSSYFLPIKKMGENVERVPTNIMKTPAKRGITFDMVDPSNANEYLDTQFTLENENRPTTSSNASEKVISITPINRKKPKLFSREPVSSVTSKFEPLFGLTPHKLQFNFKNFSVGNSHDKSGDSNDSEHISPNSGLKSESISVVLKKSLPTSCVSLSASRRLPTISLFSTMASMKTADKRPGDNSVTSVRSINPIVSERRPPNSKICDSLEAGGETKKKSVMQEQNKKFQLSLEDNITEVPSQIAIHTVDGRNANNEENEEGFDDNRRESSTAENLLGKSISVTNGSNVAPSHTTDLKQFTIQLTTSLKNNSIIKKNNIQIDHVKDGKGSRTRIFTAPKTTDSHYKFYTRMKSISSFNHTLFSPIPMTPQKIKSFSSSQMSSTPISSHLSYGTPHLTPSLPSPYSTGTQTPRDINPSSSLGTMSPVLLGTMPPVSSSSVGDIPPALVGNRPPSSVGDITPSSVRDITPSSVGNIPPALVDNRPPVSIGDQPSALLGAPFPVSLDAMLPASIGAMTQAATSPESVGAMPLTSLGAMPPASTKTPLVGGKFPSFINPPSHKQTPPLTHILPQTPTCHIVSSPYVQSSYFTSNTAMISESGEVPSSFCPKPRTVLTTPPAELTVTHKSSETSDFSVVCSAPPIDTSPLSQLEAMGTLGKDFSSSLIPDTTSPSQTNGAVFSPLFHSGFNADTYASSNKSGPNEDIGKPFSFFGGENQDSSMSGDERVCGGLFNFKAKTPSEPKANFFSLFEGVDEYYNTSQEKDGFKLF